MKKILASWLVLLGAVVGVVSVAQPVMAEEDICSSSISEELKEIAGCKTTQRADTVVNSVIQIAIGMIGLLAVLVMIYGGFMFLTSTGDASKVAKGKNILIYGLVGLIVAIMAFAIVSFVGAMVGR